jgi:hypothetical protein
MFGDDVLRKSRYELNKWKDMSVEEKIDMLDLGDDGVLEEEVKLWDLYKR